MIWTIGRKLGTGFGIGVVILVGLVLYNFIGFRTLAFLQDEGAGRSRDAIMATDTAGMAPRMYQVVADAVINRDLAAAEAEWKEAKKQMEDGLAKVGAVVDTPKEVQLHKEGVAAFKAFVSLFETEMLPVLRKSGGVPDEIKVLDGRIDEQVEIIQQRIDAIRHSLVTESEEADSTFDSIRSQTVTMSTTTAVVASILLIVIGVLVSRSIVGPIRRMIDAMLRLAKGDTSVDVPAVGRKDEIGEMAGAVQVFKDNAIEKVRLEAEQEEKERKAEAEKRAAMNKMADAFEASVGQVVDQVSSAATEMQSSSEAMSATAEEATRQSAAVAAASEQASANVQTVASAAEELSSSIAEISRQVTQASQIASAAVKEAEQTNVKVQGLATAANKIGEVVALITDIAEQTNLLALNATIEAARAGDAGKGFAVVASEVKNLANQTAKATDEIGAQISGIQAATKEAVTAIESISKTISQINEVNSGVASAVEEQGAATQEIARNVEQAAAGTQEVSSNIGGVSQAANETGAAAEQIRDASADLSKQSEVLRTEVKKFLATVRAT